jgi:hypothetical protein
VSDFYVDLVGILKCMNKSRQFCVNTFNACKELDEWIKNTEINVIVKLLFSTNPSSNQFMSNQLGLARIMGSKIKTILSTYHHVHVHGMTHWPSEEYHS